MLPFLNPRSPNSMLSLYHGIIPKVVSALFTTLNWGGGGEGETKFVLSMFNNFVILAGMVSRILSKVVIQEFETVFSLFFLRISSISLLVNLTSSPRISNAAQNTNEVYCPFL